MGGWPTGARSSERCAAHRHFLGYQDDAAGKGLNLRNPYLMRALMGFCVFHGCKEERPLGVAMGADHLIAHGVGAMPNIGVDGAGRVGFV